MSAANRDRAELIEQLSGAWHRITKVRGIATDANFFELGGDSLLAVSLLLEIERVTGHKLSITTIYDAATIEDQAALIEGEASASPSLVVPLKEGGTGTPIFIVHGIGGTVMELAKLARAIRTDAPVYAIQAQGLDGTSPPLESIVAMAALYVEAIKPLHSTGPYLLAGYSFGGMVALEMARILMRDAGEHASVFMIDSHPHPLTWPRWVSTEQRVRRHLNRAKLAAMQPRKTLASLRARAAKGSSEPLPAPRRLWPYEPDPSLPLPFRQVHEAGGTALVAYAPEFFPGHVTFLKARKSGVTYPLSASAIWRKRVAKFDLETAPGDHVSLIREHYDVVAERLSVWSKATHPQPSPSKARLDGRAPVPLAVGRV